MATVWQMYSKYSPPVTSRHWHFKICMNRADNHFVPDSIHATDWFKTEGGVYLFRPYPTFVCLFFDSVRPWITCLSRSALESCVRGWGVSMIVGSTDLYDVAARPLQLIAGRTWKGSLFGGFKSKDGVPQMVKAYLDKKVKVDEFITHNMTLEQVNDAIELMKQGKCIRTVLNILPH
ncbi:alcohol dehydrogenase 1-like isoform X2 [Eleginops maclovinus]|uniref:alcohol dehydrogenase 1-like isoform X2 n=1 Tax=Eleginops maclovinus TaxID=56733 RepID=UPI0030805261